MFYLRRLGFLDYLCQNKLRYSYRIFWGDYRQAVSFPTRDDAFACADFLRKANILEDDFEIVKIIEEVNLV